MTAARLSMRPEVNLGEGRYVVTLDFQGAIPTKKNRLQPRVGKGFLYRYPDELRQRLQDLELSARVQWGRRPITHPDLNFWLKVSHERQDKDGILTTLLDVLVKAGVLGDDSIRWCNGTWTVHQAEITSEERVGAVVEVIYKP